MMAWKTSGVLVVLLAFGCTGGEDQCVADCDACQSAVAAAETFLEVQPCASMLDCTAVEAFCQPGAPCGTVAVSVNADAAAWQDLYAEVEDTCACEGAPTCGAAVMCTDAGNCQAAVIGETYCDSVARDVQAFLADNRSCQSDADCIGLVSICHVDACESVAVNAQADAAAWERLDQALFECGGPYDPDGPSYCNFEGDCVAQNRCNEVGQCEAAQ